MNAADQPLVALAQAMAPGLEPAAQPFYVQIKSGAVVRYDAGLIYGAGKVAVQQQWEWLCMGGEQVVVLTPEEYTSRQTGACHLSEAQLLAGDLANAADKQSGALAERGHRAALELQIFRQGGAI